MDESVVDSSVFIAALKRGDVSHKVAQRAIERIESGHKAIMSWLVPVEVCGALGRTTGKDIAERALTLFDGLALMSYVRYEELNRRRASEAASIAISRGLRGPDSVVVQLAKEFECKLWTLDEEIIKRVRGFVKAEKP